MSSITAGEFAENEVRKDFTASERVAILRSIEKKPVGDQSRSQNLATADGAADHAGFGNRETARQATQVVDKGTPELQEAMDRGDLAISTAAKVAELPLHPTAGAFP